MLKIVNYYINHSKKYAACTEYEKWEYSEDIATTVSDVLSCIIVFAMCIALVIIL